MQTNVHRTAKSRCDAQLNHTCDHQVLLYMLSHMCTIMVCYTFLYITLKTGAPNVREELSRGDAGNSFLHCRPCAFLHCTLNIINLCWKYDQYSCYCLFAQKQCKSMCSLVRRSIPMLWELTRGLAKYDHQLQHCIGFLNLCM